MQDFCIICTIYSLQNKVKQAYLRKRLLRRTLLIHLWLVLLEPKPSLFDIKLHIFMRLKGLYILYH